MQTLTAPISVIIPFYQTNPEPLRRAIDSILGQQGVDLPNIIIVDDGSPLSAQEIIDGYFEEQKPHILLIRQTNSGAAKARNTGLDRLPESTQYIAFLDSDDEWVPNHLLNALELLQGGYDFYFSDHQRPDWEVSKFEKIGLNTGQHRAINNSDKFFEYVGNPLTRIMQDHMVQTSSVVCNMNACGNIRFPTNLILGEDEVFWVKAAKASRRIAFNRQIEVYMGKGVNISQGGDFGSKRSFELMLQNCRYWQSVVKLLPSDHDLEKLRRYRLQQLAENMAASLLFRIKRRQAVPMKEVYYFTLKNPVWLFYLIKLIFSRMLGNK